jgi:sporulation protein YlmC with PRC-barrel domain
MEKTYSQIIGTPIVVEDLGRVGRITDIAIDTETGKVACFFVNTGNMQVITPNDIIFFDQAIVIGDREDIVDAEDIIRVNNVLERDISILKSRVETQKGEFLGNVYDFVIDVDFAVLTKIVVYKSFFALFKSKDLLISAGDIIKIEKGLVTVKNKYAKKPITAKDIKKYPNLYPADLAS